MTIEEFRAKINSGPNAEELKVGFEKRIAEIANKTIDERDDLKKMEKRISDLEEIVEKLRSAIETTTDAIPDEPA